MPIIDARHYKALLISPNKNIKAEINPLLAQGLPLAPIHDVNAYPNRRQLADLLRTARTEALLSGFLNRTAGIQRAERFTFARPTDACSGAPCGG